MNQGLESLALDVITEKVLKDLLEEDILHMLIYIRLQHVGLCLF